MKKWLLILLIAGTFSTQIMAVEFRRLATWNMKWLGTNSGSQLDPVEKVSDYADVIVGTKATAFALQEIGATHSINGQPRCYYLDLIVKQLTKKQGVSWVYKLDKVNKNQRLAFLYRTDHWSMTNVKSIKPGKSFRYIRKPFSGQLISKETGKKFQLINVHFKAFPGEKSKKRRSDNIHDLATFMSGKASRDVIILGDTNIYTSDGDIEAPLRAAGFLAIADQEKTSIHKNVLSQRFDRFYLSNGMKQEYQQAVKAFGKDALDVIKDSGPSYITQFDAEISDHFPVVLAIPVSL